MLSLFNFADCCSRRISLTWFDRWDLWNIHAEINQLYRYILIIINFSLQVRFNELSHFFMFPVSCPVSGIPVKYIATRTMSQCQAETWRGIPRIVWFSQVWISTKIQELLYHIKRSPTSTDHQRCCFCFRMTIINFKMNKTAYVAETNSCITNTTDYNS